MDQSVFEIWAYRTIIFILIGIVGWVIRRYAAKVTDRLDTLIVAIYDLGTKYVGHDERLKSQSERIDEHVKRLDDHSRRLRHLEQNKAGNGKD